VGGKGLWGVVSVGGGVGCSGDGTIRGRIMLPKTGIMKGGKAILKRCKSHMVIETVDQERNAKKTSIHGPQTCAYSVVRGNHYK